MITLSSKERIEYVLKRDRESDNPSLMILRPLTVAETEECENLLSSRAGKGVQSGTFKLRILKLGFIGWENVQDDEGKDIEFELDRNGRVSTSILQLLSPSDRTEIQDAIWERGNVSEEDEKN